MVNDPLGIIKRPSYTMQPKRPNYRLDYHPRAFSKPLGCRTGRHPPGKMKRIIGPDTLPYYYCTACGAGVPQGLFDRTWSRSDMNKLAVADRQQLLSGKKRTRKEIMEDAWRRHSQTEAQKRERMNQSIEQFVKDRMIGE